MGEHIILCKMRHQDRATHIHTVAHFIGKVDGFTLKIQKMIIMV